MSDSKFQLARVSGAPVANDEILSDLRRAAELAGTTVVTQKLYSEFGRYNPSTALRRFGTWNNAVVAAGLQVANEINFTDERLFKNIMLLWEHFERQPRRAELARPPSVISQSAYLRRFHSWTAALTQFVAYANAKDTRPPGPVEISKGHKTGRDVSLRLRFPVMKRDNFSCRAAPLTMQPLSRSVGAGGMFRRMATFGRPSPPQTRARNQAEPARRQTEIARPCVRRIV